MKVVLQGTQGTSLASRATLRHLGPLLPFIAVTPAFLVVIFALLLTS